ncbi:hypothetical protein T4D_8626 [Trichinella pseudospiralis]|uniref:Uncharacterized protein n=1 Tax=Trichinella pseudospiralis TaxID=6337 RepID=A0A0V1FEK9_TRIPS|nr:hypothetical protein T4D_8626 [Trichinella pseudospiralis]
MLATQLCQLAVDCVITDAQARRSHRLTAKPKRQDKLDFNKMIDTALTSIDLSDPQSSIGQKGQSTELCLQANPHTISLPPMDKVHQAVPGSSNTSERTDLVTKPRAVWSLADRAIPSRE